LTPLAVWSSSIVLRYSRSMDRRLAKMVFRTANPVLVIAFLGAIFSTPHLTPLVYILQ